MDDIKSAFSNLPEGFECEKIDERIWLITTPFKYPDGDLIQIYVIQKSRVFELTDLAETMRMLEMLDLDSSSSKRKQFNEILKSYNIVFSEKELKTTATAKELTHAILNLSQAIIGVCNLYL